MRALDINTESRATLENGLALSAAFGASLRAPSYTAEPCGACLLPLALHAQPAQYPRANRFA